MATKARRKRRRYSDEQRRTIVETAQRDGLTAADVHKKFGVTPVTYYSWRKKAKAPARRGRPPGSGRAAAASQGDLTSMVQQKVRAILPSIVRLEVNSYLDQVLGTNGAGAPRRRRRRRVKA